MIRSRDGPNSFSIARPLRCWGDDRVVNIISRNFIIFEHFCKEESIKTLYHEIMFKYSMFTLKLKINQGSLNGPWVKNIMDKRPDFMFPPLSKIPQNFVDSFRWQAAMVEARAVERCEPIRANCDRGWIVGDHRCWVSRLPRPWHDQLQQLSSEALGDGH